MAYDFLKKLFGTQKDGEQAKTMTYEELEAAIDAEKDIQVVDLKAGGYVAKEKLDGKITELNGVKQQLEDAHKEIQSYKEMDIDGIKKAAADWEEKYKKDTADLNEKIEKQATEYAIEKYLSKYKFSAPILEDAIKTRFMAQEFKRSEDGTFLGADDFMKKMQEENPAAFVIETPPESQDPPKPKPQFAPPNSPTPPKSGKKMTLTEKMQYMKDHPDTDVDSLFDD